MILVEHGPGGQPALFQGAATVIVARRLREVVPALIRAEEARRLGGWVAGYLGYEAGYALEPRLVSLAPRARRAPLVMLGVFDAPGDAGPALVAMEDAARDVAIAPPRPLIARAAYERAVARVLDYIAAGDCYQVNLTFPLAARLVSGDAAGLYGLLRRGGQAGHGAFIDMPAGPAIVSLSPELFFRLDASGRIEARPMKGTRPRDPDPARDRAIAADLAASPKDRAENLMIVDLLRNDIGRISLPGSVRVPALHVVETYETVHQMVSTVEGRLAVPPSLPGLMRALFPCGSVTGAPKIRAMEIIREVETRARDAYCGAIGWMAPDGRADFSVAIRTLAVRGQRVRLDVGGGVVQGSTAAGEWEEALWKTRFTQAAVRTGFA